ncbi:MAG: 1-deoxy-D-xylulose-5-phosphate reductoisomerase, partial [Oscillospiraceae bacterium]
LNALVGIVGLKPTMAAISAKKDIALANKETLVTAGRLVMESASKNNVKILPVDSEHSAIFQCLQDTKTKNIKSIILTASGGPFFGKTKADLENVTIEEALNHPSWSMGKKITIDSATMMNKGLEIIEACHLFKVRPKNVQVLIHRESVIHSLVEFEDNAIIAQLGTPDMKLPIQYALTYPLRKDCDVKRLSLTEYGTLSFSKPDMKTFDCMQACVVAMNLGGLYPALVNGANEKAVELFLNGEIPFLEISRLVMASITGVIFDLELTIDNIFEIDRLAREYVQSHYKKIQKGDI